MLFRHALPHPPSPCTAPTPARPLLGEEAPFTRWTASQKTKRKSPLHPSISAHHSPPSPRVGGLRRSSLDTGTSNKQLLNYRKSSTPVLRTTGMLASALSEMPDQRQRRLGSTISSNAHARMAATLQDHRRLSVENSTAHHLRRRNSDQPSTSGSSNSALLSQLQMPPFSQQTNLQESESSAEQTVAPALTDRQCHPEAPYTNGLNGLNYSNGSQLHHLHPGQTGGLQGQQMSVEGMLSHVSSVLSSCGIPFFLTNRVFTLEHQGVQLQILISSNITIQYLAGDTSQYQRVCAQLYNQLQRINYSIAPQRVCATTYVS